MFETMREMRTSCITRRLIDVLPNGNNVLHSNVEITDDDGSRYDVSLATLTCLFHRHYEAIRKFAIEKGQHKVIPKERIYDAFEEKSQGFLNDGLDYLIKNNILFFYRKKEESKV